MSLTDNQISLVFFTIMVLCLALYAGIGWLVTPSSIGTTVRTWEDIRPGYLEQRKQMQAQINKLDTAEYCPPQTGNGGYRPDPCQL